MLCGKDSTAHRILRSLLKEKWSISFKLYKKEKTSYCKCTIYRITSKTNQGDTLKKPIDCKLNWKPIGGNLLVNRFCCTEFYHDQLKVKVFHMAGCGGLSVIDSNQQQRCHLAHKTEVRLLPFPCHFGEGGGGRSLHFVLKHQCSDF